MGDVSPQRQHDAGPRYARIVSKRFGKTVKLALAVFVSLSLASTFTLLGIWQVQRLAWKRDLIARVEARINAPPSSVPRARGMARASAL